MNQADVAHTPGFETPTMFGEAHIGPVVDPDGIRAVSLRAGRSVPRDAAEVAWLYPLSEQKHTWILLAFEEHRVTAIHCARIVRPDEIP